MKILNLILALIMLFSFSCKEEKKDTVQTKQSETRQTKGEDIKLAPVDFKSGIENTDVQLIDVRTPEEFVEGHLKSSQNINFYNDNFIDQIIKEFDKSKPLYIYCRSGGRSGKAAAKLSELGFKVYDLKGGILDWKAQNFKIEK